MEDILKFIRSVRSYLVRHRLVVAFGILSLLIVLFVLIPLVKIVFLSNKEALWQASSGHNSFKIYFTNPLCGVDYRNYRIYSGSAARLYPGQT